MTNAAAELFDRALQLSEAERAELACLLMDSVGEVAEDLDAVWVAEARRRLADVDSGRSAASPWSETRKRIFAAP